MVKELIKRSEFARRAGVSAAAVTKACNTLLADAVEGKRINAAHPSAVAYLKDKENADIPSAATGIDPLYESAVEYCRANNCYSMAGLQKGLKIGYVRARAIIGLMKIANIIPDKSGTTKPQPQVSLPESEKESSKSTSIS